MKNYGAIIIKFVLILIIFFGVNSIASADEAHYRDMFCKRINGVTESHIYGYNWRVDCETNSTVYEVEFAHKRDEAIGQALRYSMATGKKPGIVLIILSSKDRQYLWDLRKTLKYHKINIDIKTIGP